MKTFVKLAQTMEWLNRVIDDANEFGEELATDALAEIMAGAPSGSGVDCGTTLKLAECKPDKIVLSTSFHHMDEDGYYNGWTEHQIILRPTFGGYTMRITGKNHNDIKGYLMDLYGAWLDSETA